MILKPDAWYSASFSRFESPVDLNDSQTLESAIPYSPLFESPVDLNDSQTVRNRRMVTRMFESPVDLND